MQQRRGTLNRDHFEIAQLIDCRLKWIKSQCRAMFYEEFGGENCTKTPDVYCKISAVYYTAYHTVNNMGLDRPLIGLPWLFPEILVPLSRGKLPTEELDFAPLVKKGDTAKHTTRSVLLYISDEILRLGPSADIKGSRRSRMKAFEKLQRAVQQVNGFAVFGSTATGFDTIQRWTLSSILTKARDLSEAY